MFYCVLGWICLSIWWIWSKLWTSDSDVFPSPSKRHTEGISVPFWASWWSNCSFLFSFSPLQDFQAPVYHHDLVHHKECRSTFHDSAGTQSYRSCREIPGSGSPPAWRKLWGVKQRQREKKNSFRRVICLIHKAVKTTTEGGG